MCSLRAIKDVVVRTLIHTPTPPQRNPSNGEKMHVLPRRIMHRGPTTPTTLALVCLARLHTLCREMIYHTDEFIDHCETFPFLSRNLLMQLNHSREGLVQTGRAISNQMAIVHRSIMQLMVNDEWHWPPGPTQPYSGRRLTEIKWHSPVYTVLKSWLS